MIPRDLPGVDPAWSRFIEVREGATGTAYSWHVLDNGPLLAQRGEAVVATLLCVHGNPTWSYLWRRVLEQAPPGWRVVAVDQLGMGWSERTTAPRTLSQRVADLGDLTEALQVRGPMVTLAHDWGGPIALGWALEHPDDLAGVVLTNTAVHQPVQDPRPIAITTARSGPLRDLLCRRTPVLVRATTATCLPPLTKAVRDAFASPYATAGRRQGVADFVADVPFEAGHRSRATLDAIAERITGVQVPSLLVWGTRDPVFSRRYLADLHHRMPHADIQVYPAASHLVLEDVPEGVEVIWQWLAERVPHPAPAPARPVGGQVAVTVATDSPETLSIVELGGRAGRITAGDLAERVADVATALHCRGVRAGHRVAVLVPPGIDLTTVVYAVWRLGAVVVVADAGLGVRRLGAALRGVGPDHVVAVDRARALLRATRVPGARIAADPDDVQALIAHAAAYPRVPAAPEPPAADGAILFTSGATGPPKGVAYSRAGLGAQVALLRDTFGLEPGERFVAAFAPFALYGPALGLTSAVPDMDVTAPHTLTASALAEAVEAVQARVVFASPAALRNVVATADALTPAQREVLAGPRLVLSAGAPVPTSLLRQVKELLPSAATHTPYGMTEVLPVATIDPTTVTDEGDGVCVGPPLAGVQVRIAPLRPDGSAADETVETPGVLGELVVRGPHLKQRYDRRWAAQRASERPPGWHRTGDVGQLDERGRLWVQGRGVHVLTTPEGPLAPYAVEHRVRALPGVADAAVVGVGPAGVQQAVVVVVPVERIASGLRARLRPGKARRSPLVGPALASAVRAASGVPVAAVLVRDWLPVDIRHASKVDRSALAGWAGEILHPRSSGPRLGRVVRGAVFATARAPSTRSR